MTDGSPQDRRAFLTVTQTAALWAISDDVVYAAIKKGSLLAYRVGGSLRIRVRDAEQWGQPTSDPATHRSVSDSP